jgi:hypothetical protein
MYGALTQWADVEDVLGDGAKATSYRAKAQKLKLSFDKPIDQGGFWDAANGQYVYWRDADSSIHGTNLVTPVQFAAIGYGVCDDPARVNAILSRIEAGTAAEGLFSWPLNMTAYAAGEQGSGNFPTYENGDLFLSWNELAIRSYVKYAPDLAVKYVKSVINRYNSDGLAHQRYLRKDQSGAGDDILAGNYMTIAGLYGSVYGVQPYYNRIYLEPHLTAELNGTLLKYNLRGRQYLIGLQDQKNYSVSAGGLTVGDTKPFAVDLETSDRAVYFPGSQKSRTLTIVRSNSAALNIDMGNWSSTAKRWSEYAQASTTTTHTVAELMANTSYDVYINGALVRSVVADGAGTLSFVANLDASTMYDMSVRETMGGSGGTAGAGGSGGTADAGGTGGGGGTATVGGAGGSGGTGGVGGPQGSGASSPARDGGGCGCVTAGAPVTQTAVPLASLFAMVFLGRRRRASARRGPGRT